MGESLVNTDSARITRKITRPHTSFTAPFHSFSTALKISTHTHTLIPAKACCTQARWENASMTGQGRTMIRDGNTTPRVATMPPMMPRRFWPINVAVFTAMTPGYTGRWQSNRSGSSSVAQPLFSTTSRCRIGSMA